MNLEIQKKENPLLSRVEIEGTVSFDKATPSNADMQAELAKKLACDKELVVVRHIYTDFGKQMACVEAYQYLNPDAKAKIEKVKKVKVKAPEEKKEAKK